MRTQVLEKHLEARRTACGALLEARRAAGFVLVWKRRQIALDGRYGGNGLKNSGWDGSRSNIRRARETFELHTKLADRVVRTVASEIFLVNVAGVRDADG